MTTRLRFGLVALLLSALAGCTGDSALPNPTGKGTVRALNAIAGGPDVRYLIEATTLESLAYKSASAGRRWDDFEYRFSFEASFPGEAAPRRILSQLLKVEPERDYTFVLTGSITAPVLDLWETDERSFESGDTVFEVRFTHLAPSLGTVDVYLDAAGVAPAAGAARGTLGYGETLAPLDIETGDYVLTLTSAGNPADIVYQSDEATYLQQITFIVSVFDGDETDVAAFDVRRFNALGGILRLPDVRFPPTVRLVQASMDLATADVYADEMLTDLVIADHAFGDVTGDLPAVTGTNELFYTPAGNTGAVLFDSPFNIGAGTHNNFIVIGEEGSRTAITFVPERRSISTVARFTMYHAALNHDFLDLYIVGADEPIDDVSPVGTLTYSFNSPAFTRQAGSYDLYLTVRGEKTVVAGPVRLDLVTGDVVEMVIFDVTDPALAELRVLPAP